MSVATGPTGFADLRFVRVFERPPVAAVADNTTFFEAGALLIGLEQRVLNEQILSDVYGPERAREILAQQYGPDAVLSEAADEGTSIHVFEGSTRTEHLRFDDLDGNKHYHYLRADGRHAIVWYDDVANGPFLPWALRTLRSQIRPMLALAGAEELAARMDDAALEHALGEVERQLGRATTVS